MGHMQTVSKNFRTASLAAANFKVNAWKMTLMTKDSQEEQPERVHLVHKG